jgi:hypothetical protein
MIRILSRATATLALTASTAFALAGVGQAAIFTSKAAFLAATTGITTVDFEGLIPPDTATIIANNTTISEVTFTNPWSFLFVLNCVTFPNNFGNCTDAIPLVGPTSIVATGVTQNLITATLPSGITAVGVDLLPYNINNGQVTVSISTGDSQTVNVGNNVQFVGFTSTTPITFLRQFSANTGLLFDNLVYGQANSVNPPSPTDVPEPSTVAGLLLVGSLGLGLARRKS